MEETASEDSVASPVETAASAAESVGLTNQTGNGEYLDAGSIAAAPRCIAELFHRLKRLIPENQTVTTVGPNASVAETLKIMRKGGFSQVPVVEGTPVLGLF